jgi:hypothetical protein
MTHEGLNQKEQRYNMDHFEEGAKVYFYRSPSVLDVIKKTRKAKHIDHYVGPAVIVKKIGSRSFQISYTNPLTGTTQLLQKDAGMIILKKEWLSPSLVPSENRLILRKHQEGMELQVGELVIMMDYPDAKDWYVAEVAQVLGDRFTVNGSPPLGHRWRLTGQQAGKIECERSKESASTGLGARTKAKGRAPSSRQHISKEKRSTCGIGGSPPVRRISCCSSGTSPWRRMDA